MLSSFSSACRAAKRSIKVAAPSVKLAKKRAYFSPIQDSIGYKSLHNTTAGIYPTWHDRDFERAREVDLFSRLLKDRIIYLDGPITDQTAAVTVAQLLLLDSEDAKTPIQMYINSPGGHVTAGMAIYDTMQFIRAPVATTCVGQACSMASLLLAAGAAGQRRSLPHSFVMIHQPSSGTQGQASDMERATRQILRIKAMLNDIYVKHTGQSHERIERDLDRDTWLSAEEAKEWRLIDSIILKREDPASTAKPASTESGASNSTSSSSTSTNGSTTAPL